MTTIHGQLTQEYHVEPKRAAHAQEIFRVGAVSLTSIGYRLVEALVNGNHSTILERNPDNSLSVKCSCPDWKTWGLHHRSPCKHELALALMADAHNLLLPVNGAIPVVGNGHPNSSADEDETEPMSVQPSFPVMDNERPIVESFPMKVMRAVSEAIESLADRIDAVLTSGGIPFLIGPTGCGKTSAVRLVAVRHGWGFEEVSGSASFADADLVGLKTDHLELPGVFARAFRRARDGTHVLLFLDELLRFNQRAQDILMRPLQPAPVTVARAMGLPSESALRIVEAPLWGVEYAPADRVRIVLAANPWGSAIDPALIRRVEPIPVGMEASLLSLFSRPIASAIEASWKATERGELPLPVEYQSLLSATRPDDGTFLTRYLTRLQVVDKAAAEGYAHLLQGMGVKV